MSLLIQSGSGIITGADGETRLNTDDAFFHPLSHVSGEQAITSFTNPDDTERHTVNSYELGSCHASANDILGSVKFTLANYAAGMAFDRWHTIMGMGAILWVIDGHNLIGSSPDPNGNLKQMVFYEFRLAGGKLYLDRHLHFSRDGQGSYTVIGHTIKYKIDCGIWV